MEMWEEIVASKSKMMKEAKKGGELTGLPCPMCGRPRSQRSDYIRCTPCAANWLEGEDLSKHPHLSREPYLSSVKNKGTGSTKTETDGSA